MRVMFFMRSPYSSKAVDALLEGGVDVMLFTGEGELNSGPVPQAKGLEILSTWRDRVGEADLIIADSPTDYFKVHHMNPGKPILYLETGYGRSQMERLQRVLAPWILDLQGLGQVPEQPGGRKRRWWRRRA